ncbi:MAG TPA: ArsA-related P-loop ATPase [Vicinamibacteria bacterium]|nr:ArsA-related P-loop ATPase [Vicinamibacteria bacterium]
MSAGASAGRRALRAAVRDRKVLVIGGAGGVGKTTTAAALALQAAVAGRQVLVCTIDPSRRLVTSLGLRQLGDRPRALDLGKVAPEAKGTLWAMTLDTQRTFDALVERHAPSEEARARILGNRFYQQVSAALAGSHEYMAMEKLLELVADPRFDLVVLDTPPTRHALDFLEAPERLMGFLDTSVLRWVLRPYFVAGRLTLKVATRTGALALKIADRVLGVQFLQDLSEFFLAFEGLYEGFKERAGQVQKLLREPGSAFVLVAAPAKASLEEALFFHERLAQAHMPFVSFIVNRVHPDPAATPPPRGKGRPAVKLDRDLKRRLVEVFQDQQSLARAERRHIAQLGEKVEAPVVPVPERETDVHDLRGLKEVGEAILGLGLGRVRSRARAGARAGAGGVA